MAWTAVMRSMFCPYNDILMKIPLYASSLLEAEPEADVAHPEASIAQLEEILQRRGSQAHAKG